jgi:recombination protein RecT
MSRATAQPPARREQNGTPKPAQPTGETFLVMLEKSRDEFVKLLPEHVSVDRVMRVARSVYNSDANIQRCEPVSIIRAVMKSCELGLEPGGARKHGWMIGYGSSCEFQVGYQGMLELARRSKEFRVIEAVIVHENDQFQILRNPAPQIHHAPCITGDPGKMIGVYAYAILNSGAVVFEHMTCKEVDRCRQCSKAPNSPAWRNWYEQMGCRSVLNRLLKRQPQSVELAEALEYVNQEFVEDGTESTVRVHAGSRREALAHRIGALPAPEPTFTEGTAGQVTSEADDAEPTGDDTATDELPLGRQPGDD